MIGAGRHGGGGGGGRGDGRRGGVMSGGSRRRKTTKIDVARRSYVTILNCFSFSFVSLVLVLLCTVGFNETTNIL
jgi:hypothetical protein